jgi:hypothetical protein
MMVPMGPKRTTSTRAKVPRKEVPLPSFATFSMIMVSSLVTAMPILTPMPMPLALLLTLMIASEFLFAFVGSVTGSVVLSLYVSCGFIRGGHVIHNLPLLPGLAS